MAHDESLLDRLAARHASGQTIRDDGVVRFSIGLGTSENVQLEALAESLGVTKAAFCAMVVSDAVAELQKRLEILTGGGALVVRFEQHLRLQGAREDECRYLLGTVLHALPALHHLAQQRVLVLSLPTDPADLEQLRGRTVGIFADLADSLYFEGDQTIFHLRNVGIVKELSEAEQQDLLSKHNQSRLAILKKRGPRTPDEHLATLEEEAQGLKAYVENVRSREDAEELAHVQSRDRLAEIAEAEEDAAVRASEGDLFDLMSTRSKPPKPVRRIERPAPLPEGEIPPGFTTF